MRKMTGILLAVCLSLSLCACGQNSTSSAVSATENQTSETSYSEAEHSSVINGESEELIYTFKDPFYKIAFDYPDFQVIEEATSRIFRNSSQWFIDYSIADDMVYDLEEIPEKLMEYFKYATNTKITIGDAKEFDIKEKNEITINGTEVLEIKGNLLTLDDYNGATSTLPMIGYTFVKDGCSAELIGVIDGEDKDGAFYAEMEKTIKAMINTLRDDR